MKPVNRIFTAIALIAVLPFIMGPMCSESVPIREMSTARMEISRALAVRADKYAAPEMEEAKKYLLRSHEFIRDNEQGKAAESAVAAHKKAREAYEKALPFLARDTIDVAEKSLNEAEEAYAPVLAKDEFEQAQGTLKNATEQFDNKKYYEAYEKSIEADRLAKSARNTALGKQTILRDAIEEVKATLAEAKKYNAGEFAPDKVKSAEEGIRLASEAFAGLELRKGFSAVEAARVNADEAYVESLKRSAQADMAAAEALIGRAAKSEGAKIAKDEMEGAKESLAGSKTLYADSRYKESLIASGEARRLAAIVLGAKSAETAKKEVKDTAAAGAVKEEGKKEKPGETGEFKIYRVKYNPSGRDCLWKIAGRYYGNPRLWKKIFEANRDKIKNPDIIQPGMPLKIPVPGKPKAAERKSGTDLKKAPDAVKKEEESPGGKKSDTPLKDEGGTVPPINEDKEIPEKVKP